MYPPHIFWKMFQCPKKGRKIPNALPRKFRRRKVAFRLGDPTVDGGNGCEEGNGGREQNEFNMDFLCKANCISLELLIYK